MFWNFFYKYISKGHQILKYSGHKRNICEYLVLVSLVTKQSMENSQRASNSLSSS